MKREREEEQKRPGEDKLRNMTGELGTGLEMEIKHTCMEVSGDGLMKYK